MLYSGVKPFIYWIHWIHIAKRNVTGRREVSSCSVIGNCKISFSHIITNYDGTRFFAVMLTGVVKVTYMTIVFAAINYIQFYITLVKLFFFFLFTNRAFRIPLAFELVAELCGICRQHHQQVNFPFSFCGWPKVVAIVWRLCNSFQIP